MKSTSQRDYWVRRANNAEDELYCELQSKGFDIYTRGWPDCIAHNRTTGEIRFIEVKPASRRKRLGKYQTDIAELLAKFGIIVEIHHSTLRGRTKGRKRVRRRDEQGNLI